MKYRKKPVVIEAVQFTGNNVPEIKEFMNVGGLDAKNLLPYDPFKKTLKIHTLEGVMTASDGDFIIRGVEGEFYPCKPEIFGKTYEVVNEHT